jgi:hypothetical protein
MKLIRTKDGRAQRAETLLPPSNSAAARRSDAVLPAVKRIVADVRKRGDRALLRYAAKFDGALGGARMQPMRVTRGRDGRGVGGDRSRAARCACPRRPTRFAHLPSAATAGLVE